MKSRVFVPFLALAGLILAVGLACVFLTGTPVPTPTSPPPPPPVSTPRPTSTTAPVVIQVPATPEPTELPAFFTDELEGDLSNWTYYVLAGDENELTISDEQGGILTRLDDVNLAVYFTYNPYLYNDVILDLIYQNQGRNSNNVNVVCRYSDNGWYEFTVQNDGLYQIWAVSGGYNLLYSGASAAINTGQDINEITVGCVGNTLYLYINGTEIATVDDTTYFLGEGQVGFGVNVSALNPVTPVIVNFQSFTIAEP